MIRINKHDVVYLNYSRYHDNTNCITHSMLSNSFIIRKGERLYFSDRMDNKVLYRTFQGYGDAWEYAMDFLNEHTTLEIYHFSDHPNIIVSETWVKEHEFKRLKESRG